MKELKIAYFSGEPLGVPVLEELTDCGIVPDLIVCNPDRPQGRKMILTPPPSKVYAQDHEIEIFQPESLKDKEALAPLTDGDFDLFVVVAYGKIMPKWLIELPKCKTLNLHPSLLPKLRGPSPIRTAIAENLKDQVGATIMLMDEEMDHGPIVDQMAIDIAGSEWPMAGPELDEALARMGGALLAATIVPWVAGELTPTDQDHDEATMTKKITKDMGELQIDPHELPTGETAVTYYQKIQAYAGFPGTFFFHNHKRVKIVEASLTNHHELLLHRVIPAGKSLMDFDTYLASH